MRRSNLSVRRLPRLDAALVLSVVALFGAMPLGPSRWIWWLPLAAVLAALTGVGIHRRCITAIHFGLLSTLIPIALIASRGFALWPLPAVVAAAIYLTAAKVIPSLGGLPPWLRRGKLDRATGALILASVLVSALALTIWFSVTQPDYQALRGTLLPDLPVPLLVLGVVLFAMANGALEEFVYRGAVMGALDEALGCGAASVLVQAVVFGVLHIGGFPKGLVGVGLATIYGLMMGIVRRRAGGMLAPWIAHVGTDIAIGLILLRALY
jgi:uncharacterized protein